MSRVSLELCEDTEDASCKGDSETSKGAVGRSLPHTSSKRKRGRISIVTPELAAALDRTKLYDREATFVTGESVKSGIDDLALNCDAVCRERVKRMTQQATALQAKFQTSCNVP